MSTENTNDGQPAVIDETTETNLDDFSAEFFGQNEAEPDSTKSEDEEVVKENLDATTEVDTQSEDDDALAEDDEETDEDEGEEESDPKPKKKNRFQERIDELTGKQREAERKAEELNARLTKALEKLEQNEKTETPEPKAKVPEGKEGPQPNDLDEDGDNKYPLGEFDPNFIKDLTRFTISEERRSVDEQLERAKQQAAMDSQKAELQTNWQDKLGPARERYPDFNEKGEQLIGTFEGIDEAYGEYLQNTLMEMDYGTDVLYYLASNPDEAQKIVQSGPNKATIALGRLEAKFLDADTEKQKARPKVSNAPKPPPTNKGSSAVRGSVKPDTDDLDAFSSSFFSKS